MRLNNISVSLDFDEKNLKKLACERSGIPYSEASYFSIVRKSIDARDKTDVKFIYTVDIDCSPPHKENEVQSKYARPNGRIVVVGMGPAGIFAALQLARAGLCPIVIERGSNVDERRKAIDLFISTSSLNTECNVQFGEGGAGTFSDGKLNTGVKSEYKKFVLQEFVKHGAPQEILYDAKPHIGSDRLPEVVAAMREEIIYLGGEVFFDTCLCDVLISSGAITSIFVRGKTDGEIQVSELVLAIGHSSRDTYEMLYRRGIAMETKDMAIGLRIEHRRTDIDKTQYGKFASMLGAADYKLTSRIAPRGVFTFCMCPGGYVMPATSEQNAVVTNGMSNFARDGENSNSAVVVQVHASDYGEGTLAGIDYVRRLEQAAYIAGGGNYFAPVQLLGDFISGKHSTSFGKVKPTYPIGTHFARLDQLLPSEIAHCLKFGIKDMDRRLRGFAASDAVLTGIETRTSGPLRIVRGERNTSISCSNLYPCGEVGYAGGIMSAAIDGMRIGETILDKYRI